MRLPSEQLSRKMSRLNPIGSILFVIYFVNLLHKQQDKSKQLSLIVIKSYRSALKVAELEATSLKVSVQ